MTVLVLRLKAGDCVTIGDGTVLTVKQATEAALRLAIAAPDDHEITHARAGTVVDDAEQQGEAPGYSSGASHA
ncbi:carbon storage regulator [Sediminimonas sp.]|uniref:carbon storage regulator n=1 Tax=Sediminimonas sp. TaxID=2823379 RepID=UPI0025CE965C|nr:carbon storage regulator [Sediminimonas sp.]